MCPTGDMDICHFFTVLFIIRDRKEKYKEYIHIYIKYKFEIVYITEVAHFSSEM
jgi:hypothetical protein